MAISATAWAAGMAGALLYLMFAWPLTKVFEMGTGVLSSFPMKVFASLGVGIGVAPLAETYAPMIRETAIYWITRSEDATMAYNSVARWVTSFSL